MNQVPGDEQVGRARLPAEELQKRLADHHLWLQSGGAQGHRAALQNLNLQNVDLSGANGLNAADVAGSDLTGATLPEPFSGLDKVEQIATISGLARPLFLFLLATTIFVLLSVFSTPDVALFTNTTSAVLPNLSTNIPAASLFWVAPVILLFLYVYVHFYISRIWEVLSGLPAIYVDGTPVEEKAHPWLFVRLVRLRAGLQAISFEEVVAVLLLWGAVPATLLGIWWRYLPLRNWPVTLFQIIIVLASVRGALYLFQRAVSTLMLREYQLPHANRAYNTLALFLVVVSSLFLVSPALLDAYTEIIVKPLETSSAEVTGVKPKRVKWLVAGLEDGDLSGALLIGRDLRYASGHRATLAGANLTDAILNGSDFQRADFSRAILEDSELQHANLDGANFDNACLRNANLAGADLEDASFRGAYLGQADLRQAYLSRAQLQYANLQGADLTGANLSGAYLESAVMYCYATHRHDPDQEQKTQCTNLKDAIMLGTRLKGADLRYVKNLTQAQLDGACGEARLPAGLSIKDCTETDTNPAPALALAKSPEPDPLLNPCLHEMKADFWTEPVTGNTMTGDNGSLF